MWYQFHHQASCKQSYIKTQMHDITIPVYHSNSPRNTTMEIVWYQSWKKNMHDRMSTNFVDRYVPLEYQAHVSGQSKGTTHGNSRNSMTHQITWFVWRPSQVSLVSFHPVLRISIEQKSVIIMKPTCIATQGKGTRISRTTKGEFLIKPFWFLHDKLLIINIIQHRGSHHLDKSPTTNSGKIGDT